LFQSKHDLFAGQAEEGAMEDKKAIAICFYEQVANKTNGY